MKLLKKNFLLKGAQKKRVMSAVNLKKKRVITIDLFFKKGIYETEL